MMRAFFLGFAEHIREHSECGLTWPADRGRGRWLNRNEWYDRGWNLADMFGGRFYAA